MGNRYSQRSVTIEIANNSHDVVLFNPRSYCFSGYSSTPPCPKVSPGVTKSCRFSNYSAGFRGSVGLLVYEAETFTLAILFSNPFDYNLYSIELAMEISSQKVHLKSSLEETYTRMYNQPPNPHDGAIFGRVKLKACQESITVSSELVKVMASMSNARHSTISVLVESQICHTT